MKEGSSYLTIGIILGVILSLCTFTITLSYLQGINITTIILKNPLSILTSLLPQKRLEGIIFNNRVLNKPKPLEPVPQKPLIGSEAVLPNDNDIKATMKLSPLPSLIKEITPDNKPHPLSKESFIPLSINTFGTGTGKIAIILDDAGYNMNGSTKILLNIPAPLTFSVIPGLKCSKKVAEEAYNMDKEIMLHMPMEYCNNPRTIRNGTATKEDILCQANRKNDSPYKYALLSGMSDEEVEKQLIGAINDIPHLKGINNHMGSNATADSNLMSFCMDKIKGKNLYFIDSVTSNKSIAYKTAREKGIISGRRNVFLDNEDSIKHVTAQMNILIRLAKKRGYAIGIGHATKHSTAIVLREMAPKLKEIGIEIVPASQLVN